MILTLLLIVLGFLAGMMLAKLSDRTQKRPHLNPEGFVSGLNDDISKAIQREELDAKIEAWHNSDYSGPLHEYLGMTDAEYAAFVEQREASGIVEKLPSDNENNPREPA